MGLTTNYVNSAGVDIGTPLVPKSYVMDLYPELANTFRFAGLWTWGYNNFGQLGDNTTAAKSSPVQTVAGGTIWKSVAGGQFHTAAIKTDGTLWLWGHNYYGQLGVNSITPNSSPVQTIAAGTNWKLVAGGAYHTAAITSIT